ncbi:MAG: nitroreductase [Crocinitomicaceae bacterium]|nr:nitroreductase [Crocinitomicaceae bacterium]|tara:strand:- start:20288 stop:20872 length:585 start_codon:yes stop_codon:yes gene_type:complete
MKYNLSEISDVIKNRRTIYPEFYSSRKVHKEIVEKILNNAIWAPTHGKTQPWRFKVFMGDAKMKLGENLASIYKNTIPEEKFIEAKFNKLIARPSLSSVAIAVCMIKDPTDKIMEMEEVEAVACAIQNMHLTATAYGIGGFWSTPKVIYSSEMNEFLKIGPSDKCLGIFYLGYPANEWPRGQRKPIEYLTEWHN